VKRSGPIRRKVGLKPGKPLERKPWRHDEALAVERRPSREKPIKVRRDAPRRRRRDDPDHSIPWQDVRMIIYVRSGGRCEMCGVGLNIANMEGHHRRTRKIGPDCPCNALALCSTCHHREVHESPERARGLGQIVSRHDDRMPADVPVELHGHGDVLLMCDGTFALPGPSDAGCYP
jgi:hypothetical protein